MVGPGLKFHTCSKFLQTLTPGSGLYSTLKPGMPKVLPALLFSHTLTFQTLINNAPERITFIIDVGKKK
jgi:hypothetical protein